MEQGKFLTELNNKKKLRLPHWSKDVFLLIQTPDEHSKMSSPYIYVTSRFGLVPWVATQIELLSEKWEIVEEKSNEIISNEKINTFYMGFVGLQDRGVNEKEAFQDVFRKFINEITEEKGDNCSI